ncbi:MAG: acyclic terpene utilization AtuA family protein [Vicinamibacterales bacterium]
MSCRIGCGAGYAGDRLEPAIELVERGNLDYLVFECLAERTIALAQQARAADPALGFDDRLDERMEAVLAPAFTRRIRIITNMGAANPTAAGDHVVALATRLGLHRLRVAVVTGDDVLTLVRERSCCDLDTGDPLPDALISANAYLGAEPIAAALAQGADVVITGRVADPSLFVAPLVIHYGWRFDDWTRLGRATVVGHLLECAGQVTGGYFADPEVPGGRKVVDDLSRLGFPLAEVADDGTAVITKVAGSGGCVSAATCKEQLLYELHAPSAYVTPDVVADFSRVRVHEEGRDRVRVTGADGRVRTDTLKVSVGSQDGWMGEGSISYAGPGAVARARLGAEIVAGRLRLIGIRPREMRYDVIGVDALHPIGLARSAPAPYEVRLRVAARADSARDARRIAREVEALYTNGPAGGGGAAVVVKPVLTMRSTLIPRELVEPHVQLTEVP